MESTPYTTLQKVQEIVQVHYQMTHLSLSELAPTSWECPLLCLILGHCPLKCLSVWSALIVSLATVPSVRNGATPVRRTIALTSQQRKVGLHTLQHTYACDMAFYPALLYSTHVCDSAVLLWLYTVNYISIPINTPIVNYACLILSLTIIDNCFSYECLWVATIWSIGKHICWRNCRDAETYCFVQNTYGHVCQHVSGQHM